MKAGYWLIVSVLAVPLMACGSDDGGDDGGIEVPDPGPLAGACAPSDLIGSFEITLEDTFTNVQGKVDDAVTPSRVQESVQTSGSCSLYRPPSLFCDPGCDAGTTCDATSMCVPVPEGVSIGTVTVHGLKGAVEMSASPPVFFYTNLADLEHPAFDEGDEIILVADGEGDVDQVVLGGTGISQLEIPNGAVALESGTALQLSWTVPQNQDAGTMHLDLNIAQHGGTPGWIECEVPDTGSFEIPMELTDALLERGFSGFPSITLTRRSVDSTDTAIGCVELTVESEITRTIEIPGLISCSGPDDCPDPQICQADLTCG